MKYKGFTLDKFQEDAIKAIDNNHSVVVSAPTGSGKTLIADYIIGKYLKKGKVIIYTAPIKALSNQKYKEFSEDYGEENVGLLTGDVVRNPTAPILIMTTEIYRNMVLIKDRMIDLVSYVIFDEVHYINDIERGYVWEESVIFSKKSVRFLCLSATIPNAKQFADWIHSINKHVVEVVIQTKRNVPLHKFFYDSELGVCSLDQIRDVVNITGYSKIEQGRRNGRWNGGRGGDKHAVKVKAPNHVQLVRKIQDKLPCFFFTFSRKKCQQSAEELAKANIFKINSEIISFIRQKLGGVASEINNLKSTRILRKTLPYGIAFHHAGLIPIIKELVEELFAKGLIKVLYTTETFAVGINMPAKTVCFESLRKYDGINFRFLNSKEYFQIAGRAGRRGIDKQGFVYVMMDRRDFDYIKLNKIVLKDVDPICSQFRLSVNTVLNLIKLHNQKEIEEILCKSFHTFQKYGRKFNLIGKGLFYHRFNNIKKKLLNMEYVVGDNLTWKGDFSSMIYADEILIGEIFATNFYKNLDEMHLLMLLACICYEPRRATKFYREYDMKVVRELQKKIFDHKYLKKEKRFREMHKLTALIDPCYHGKSIFDIMKNTNLLEGDLIRFFRQILDRIGQIKKATSDEKLKFMLSNCQHLVIESLKEIDIL